LGRSVWVSLRPFGPDLTFSWPSGPGLWPLSGPNRPFWAPFRAPGPLVFPCFRRFSGVFRAPFPGLRPRKPGIWALQQGPRPAPFGPNLGPVFGCFRPVLAGSGGFRPFGSPRALAGALFPGFGPFWALLGPFSGLSGLRPERPESLPTGYRVSGLVFPGFRVFRPFRPVSAPACGGVKSLPTGYRVWGPFWPGFRPFWLFLALFGPLGPPRPCFWLYSKVFWGPRGPFSAFFGLFGWPQRGQPKGAVLKHTLGPSGPKCTTLAPFWAPFGGPPGPLAKIRRDSTAFRGKATKR